MQNYMTEWSFTSGKIYRDPFNDVTLDVMFTDPDGEEHRVPSSGWVDRPGACVMPRRKLEDTDGV